MLRWSALLLVACGTTAPPEPLMNRVVTPACVRSDVPAARRFALGSTPDYNMTSIEGATPACWVDLLPGPIVKLRDGVPVLVDEGRFHGTCGGEPMTDDFESVRVASITVRQIGSNPGLHPAELDMRHPDWRIGFRVFAADACGENLRIGRRPNGRWSTSGCRGITELVGARSPRDEVVLVARGRGRCQVNVEFLGARATFAVTVR
jgi:hypothetical protein